MLKRKQFTGDTDCHWKLLKVTKFPMKLKGQLQSALVPKSERKQERLWCWVMPCYTSKRTGMPACSPTLWSTYWYSKEIKWLVIQPFLDLWPVCISCTISVIYLIITKIANNFLIPMLKKKKKQIFHSVFIAYLQSQIKWFTTLCSENIQHKKTLPRQNYIFMVMTGMSYSYSS